MFYTVESGSISQTVFASDGKDAAVQFISSLTDGMELGEIVIVSKDNDEEYFLTEVLLENESENGTQNYFPRMYYA